MPTNPTWFLKRFPSGMPTHDDFSMEDHPRPVAQSGQLLVRTLWLSVDPYMRARLSPAKNYAAGQKLGEMMMGGDAPPSDWAATSRPRLRPSFGALVGLELVDVVMETVASVWRWAGAHGRASTRRMLNNARRLSITQPSRAPSPARSANALGLQSPHICWHSLAVAIPHSG